MRQAETIDVILIDRDAYMYLRRIQRAQRGGKELTKAQEDKIWDRLMKSHLRQKSPEGLVEVTKDDFGGGDGTPDGVWTSWSLEKVKKMLADGGFTWKEGKPKEVIYVSF